MSKTFFRVAHEDTQQGVWYDADGKFTGFIHERFDFCKHHDLKMDFDSEVTGYVSATATLEKLQEWFPCADIVRLQEFGFYVYEYQCADYKWYEKFLHCLINPKAAEIVRQIVYR